MSGFLSHTPAECRKAWVSGEDVWELLTDQDGCDDTLLGPYEEILENILDHHEIQELPVHWVLQPWDPPWWEEEEEASRNAARQRR